MRVVWLINKYVCVYNFCWVHISIYKSITVQHDQIAKYYNIYIGWCTICTSERELILKTYIVMPTSTGVPEMWHTRPRFSSKENFCSCVWWKCMRGAGLDGRLLDLRKNVCERGKGLDGILFWFYERAPHLYICWESMRVAKVLSHLPWLSLRRAQMAGVVVRNCLSLRARERGEFARCRRRRTPANSLVLAHTHWKKTRVFKGPEKISIRTTLVLCLFVGVCVKKGAASALGARFANSTPIRDDCILLPDC